ncbi:MAG: WD40 repeat domain-containing protein, partial [Planctomycetota bacterium]|nr:WD40 repeat domain-containing protein [Planctomycetota bacterium]
GGATPRAARGTALPAPRGGCPLGAAPCTGSALPAPLVPPEDAVRGQRLGVTMAFSPGGKALLVDVGPRGAVILGPDGETVTSLPTRRGGWASSRARWSADGRTVHALTDEGLRAFDARTGAPRGAPLAADGRMLDFSLHPREPLVVTAHRSGAILEWSLETRAIVREWHHEDPQGFDPDQYVNCVSYDPQGDRIAFTTGSGVFLGIVGREVEEPPWYSWYCDGRAGTPAPLAWDPQGVTVWWAFAGGHLALHHHETDGVERAGETVDRGWTPTFDAKGHGVTLSDGCAVGFDSGTHELLWSLDGPALEAMVETREETGRRGASGGGKGVSGR